MEPEAGNESKELNLIQVLISMPLSDSFSLDITSRHETR